MNALMKATILALTLTTVIDAQPPALRAGVSVTMPVTKNAVPLPDADKADSLVVAVTAKGRVYFGITPVTPADLTEKVNTALSGRSGQKIFVKGDSRTPYADMAQVLAALSKAGVAAPMLLTAQPGTPEPGYPATPKGLEVLIGSPSASASIVRNGSQKVIVLKTNPQMPFGEVVRAIDQHRAEGTKVFLSTADRVQ